MFILFSFRLTVNNFSNSECFILNQTEQIDSLVHIAYRMIFNDINCMCTNLEEMSKKKYQYIYNFVHSKVDVVRYATRERAYRRRNFFFWYTQCDMTYVIKEAPTACTSKHTHTHIHKYRQWFERRKKSKRCLR